MTASTQSDQDAARYAASYYESHCSAPADALAYERSPHWLNFFGGIADRIVREIAPESSFDAGCAMGFLVEALHSRGVDAHGLDISDYAISQVHASVRDQCRVGSVLDPLPARYSLITCIEVLEHLEDADARAAVANLCAWTDDFLFSSTPDDFAETTHINVRPPGYWGELFAQVGFFRDVDFDASFISPWAVRFRRSHDGLPRVVANYERIQWDLRRERTARNTVITTLEAELAELRERARSSSLERLTADLASAHEYQLQLVEENRALRTQLESIEHSRSFRLSQAISHAATVALPQQSGRRRAVASAVGHARALRHSPAAPEPSVDADPLRREHAEYRRWLDQTEPTTGELLEQRSLSGRWGYRPLISVCVPTHDPEQASLLTAIESVRAQTYDNWELCIADDCSTDMAARAVIEAAAASDPRIKVAWRSENGGISAATNSALELATGDFVAFLDNDDVLAPQALFATVKHLQDSPTTDLIYSDEDLILTDGRRAHPFFKPDWSPEVLLTHNFITHLVVVRRSLLDEAGHLRSDFDGAQDFDLMLRVTARTDRIHHIPEILYSWRQAPNSTARNADTKPWAFEAGKRALEESLKARGVDASVTMRLGRDLGCYRTDRTLPAPAPAVTIVIPTRDRLAALKPCVEAIRQRTTYKNYSIVVVDNDSRDPAVHRFLAAAGVTVVPSPGPFNYSKIINDGIAACDDDLVITLNNDTVLQTPGWIETMVGLALDEAVGCVGCRLTEPDGRPQHEGIVVGHGLLARNLVFNAPAIRYPIIELGPREVSAVTGACSLIRRSAWQAVDGLDEDMPVGYNDVDFCLRLRRAGYSVLYTPFAEFIHAEGSSRGHMNTERDVERFRKRWTDADGGLIDPYFSHHLALHGDRWTLDLSEGRA